MYPRNSSSPFVQPIGTTGKNQGGLKDMLTLYKDGATTNGVAVDGSANGAKMTTPVKGGASSMVFTPVKENQPIAFNLGATITTPTKANNNNNNNNNNGERSPLTPVKVLNSPVNSSSSSSGSSDENDDDVRVFSKSPTSSPNFKSPKNKTLKQKRFRNMTAQLPTIKSMDDVVKLQEEITENRDKIQSLQQQLSSAQKEKGEIENEKKELLEKLKQLDEKRVSAESREKDTKLQLEDMEKKLSSTVEALHQEFDKKLSDINDERSQTEKIIGKYQERVFLFFSTCLAIKLNQLMLNTPTNICTQELWEEAEAQQITSARFTQFISQKVKALQQQQAPPSPAKSPRKQSPPTPKKKGSAAAPQKSKK
ncbi:hypothetical protein PPL_06092 [Heterostelium album PN500]|uniref:Uncharacterized protein n=1 Tax=Heterostelium pallidum (strain ATCC 26659 / Pp 5 / PN500) TaxID=670386 RepID=D3BC70_HETP5|nr:hypothetical protein PPL_06092 [Heterostelium album PN500]EFA81253.1 hypothetical protein PPL_06092 [Heterostelium album PN500]|eukprot:XP_020433371.1 hypothetical protein PPL_06092 [Heterostelium album PN500]